MRRSPQPALLCLLGAVLTAVSSAAPGTIYDVTVGGKDVRIWLPANAPVIRGLYIHGNGAGGDDRGITGQAHYQAFGAIHGFGVVGTRGFGNAIVSYDGASLMEALRLIAISSNHPELVHCPWVCGGMSNGGQMAYAFNAWKPDRVIAFTVNKGCCYENRTPSAAALKNPGILIAGATDTATRRTSIQGLFNENRPRGALWAWVEEENTGHSIGDSDSLYLLFFSEAIKARYPTNQLPVGGPVQLLPVNESSGWLADQGTWTSGVTKVYPYASYPGPASSAGWLLNETVARYYQAFSTYGKLTTISAPSTRGVNTSAPTSVNFSASTTAAPLQQVRFYRNNTLVGSSSASNGTVSVPLSPMTAYGFTAGAELADGSVRPSRLFSYFAEGTPIVGGSLTLENDGEPISQGAATPVVTNGTHFGLIDPDAGQPTERFTIRNTGSTTLSLPLPTSVRVFGQDAGQFAVDTQPSGSLGPGQTATFSIRYVGSVPGAHQAQVSIVSSATSPGPVFQFVVGATRLTPRQAWRRSRFGSIAWSSPRELVEYGLLAPTVAVAPGAGEVSFLRRSDPAVGFAAQVSTNLVSWQTIATGSSNQPMQGIGAWGESPVAGGTQVTLRDPWPGQPRFFRISLAEADPPRSAESFAVGSGDYQLGQLGGQQYAGTGYPQGGFYENSQGDVAASSLTFTKTTTLHSSGGALALVRDGLTFGLLDTAAGGPFGGSDGPDLLEGGLVGRNGTSIYFSFLTRITSNGNVGFSLFRGFSELNFFGVSTSVAGTTYDALVSGLTLNGTPNAVSTGVTRDNETHLIVGKIVFGPANADTLTLWIDPVPGASEENPGATAVIQTTAGSKNLAFDRWRFYSDGAGSSLDEVRFGGTFQSVSPAASDP